VKESGKENPPYKELANELTRAQISVELFIGANQYVDLASIAPLAKYTGGDLRYYPQFHIQTHGMKLKSEIIHVCSRKTGWEAVMRVRVSRGWKITNFYGHLFIRGQDLLVVPNCHADQTFAVTIDMEDSVNPDPVLYIQSALLYTNSDGERRIRVHTWASPTSQNFNEILNSVDVQATALMLSHMAFESSLNVSLNEGRNRLQTQCQAIVQSMAQSEMMQFLPLYIMGMLKSAAFRGGNEIGADMRTSIWMRLETLSVQQLSSYFYPRLLALHGMPPHVGVEDENGAVVLPDKQNLTKEIMTQDGVYLLEDGEIMMIWIGRSVDPGFLSSVFGANSIDELNTDHAEQIIGTLENPLSTQVGKILRQIRQEQEVPYMQLYIMKGGEGNKEIRFFNSLIEDRSTAPGMNTTYMEFLQRMGYRPPATAQAPPQGSMPAPGMTPGMAAPPPGGMPGMGGAPPMGPPGMRR
jgi:protein transport protein SEC24